VGDNPQIASYLRTFEDDKILVVNNLSDQIQEASFKIDLRQGGLIDLLTGRILPGSVDGKIRLRLQPYAYLWLLI